MSIGSNIRALTKTHKEAWKDGEKKFKTFHISCKEGQRDHPTPRAQKGREKRILLARLRFWSRRRRIRATFLSVALLTGVLRGLISLILPRISLSVRGRCPASMAGALGRLRLSRAQVIRTALFVHDAETAVPIRVRDHREHLLGVHTAPCHVREDLIFFVRESSHHFGVILDACFEVAREET